MGTPTARMSMSWCAFSFTSSSAWSRSRRREARNDRLPNESSDADTSQRRRQLGGAAGFGAREEHLSEALPDFHAVKEE